MDIEALRNQTIVVGDALHFYRYVTPYPPERGLPWVKSFELEFETLCGNLRDHRGADAASIAARMTPTEEQLRTLRICKNCSRSRHLTPELRELIEERS